MSIKPDDTKLAVLGSNNCIYTVGLENEVNDAPINEENTFEAVTDTYHTGAVILLSYLKLTTNLF